MPAFPSDASLFEDGLVGKPHEVMAAGERQKHRQILAPVGMLSACQPVGVGAVEDMVVQEVRHQSRKVREKATALGILSGIIVFSDAPKERHRNVKRLGNLYVKVLSRPRPDLCCQLAYFREAVGGGSQMKGLALCFRMKGKRYHPVCHIIDRHHVHRLVGTDGQTSQLSLQHQFQDIIDGIEITCATSMTVADNHARTTDGKRQFGCSDDSFGFCLALFVETIELGGER